jgi:myo-inositol 2-dehydrogenase / D-chiro-inositol 1-dehydrogenase
MWPIAPMADKATQEAHPPLRLGLAGCGRIVERGYLPAVRGLRGVEVVAVADPERPRAARASAGAVAFADAGEMIVAGGIEAVIVAAPAAAHLEVAATAASAGLPCLVEKPPAPDLASAAALAALDPSPSIGFNRRFLQGAELSPSIPAEGWLELELELRFRRAGWGAHFSRDEALLDAGTHLIDLAAFLTGAAPIAVRNASVEPERAELELELGRARARISCATDRPYAERVDVRDRSGRMTAGSRLGRVSAAKRRLHRGEDPLVLSLRRQLQQFAARVRGREADELAGADAGVAAMSVVEAARHSAELGGAEVTVCTLTADGPQTGAGIAFSAHRREGAA